MGTRIRAAGGICLSLAVIGPMTAAMAEEERLRPPPFPFLDGMALIAADTAIHSGRSTKSRKLAPLRKNCLVGYNFPTDGVGYKGWFRVTEHQCRDPDVNGEIAGFVPKARTSEYGTAEIRIEPGDVARYAALEVRTCPGTTCPKLFDASQIDFSQGNACIFDVIREIAGKPVTGEWRFIVTDHCLKRQGGSLAMYYAKVSGLPEAR